MVTIPERVTSWLQYVRLATRPLREVFPLTWLGFAMLCGAYVALTELALVELDLVWLVVAYAALLLVGSALLAVSVGAIWVYMTVTRRDRGADVAARVSETARRLPTGFVAPALRWFPLLQVSWRWRTPSEVLVSHSMRSFFLNEEYVEAKARGRHERLTRRFLVQDSFGLVRIAFTISEETDLRFVPHAGKLGELPLLVSMSGGDERPHPMGVEDGDRVEIRRYRPGDPARFIHWKAFGRTRKLMVRMPERSLSPARRTVAYLVSGAEDEASAAAAKVAIETGSLGEEWRFSADGAESATSSATEAVEMILNSTNHRTLAGAGLNSFLESADERGPASAVVFVPACPGPWLARVVAAVQGRSARTRIVLATDGVRSSDTRGRLRRWFVRPLPVVGTTATQLEEVLRALSSTRCEILLLDRTTGKRLSEGHREAMQKLSPSLSGSVR